ncbi:MAG: VWA domain-containing protein [Chloroflexi bacterium]|nr:VWA domain-containing protein [Chloroflexota bacterium]
MPSPPLPRTAVPPVLLGLSLALLGGGATAREVSPEQDEACTAHVSREHADPTPPPQWGDELQIELRVTLECGGRAVERLSLTEAFPAGVTLVPGVGRPADARAGTAATWRFEQPALAPTELRVSYRIYLTPEAPVYDVDQTLALGWPLFVEVTRGGQDRRLPLPELAPLRLARRQAGGGCGLARSRQLLPETIQAGDPFTVTLRLSPNLCSAHAERSRILLVWPPPADARERSEMLSATAGLVDRLQSDQAQLGLTLPSRDASPRLGPTSAYSALGDRLLGQALGLAPVDTAAMLAAGLDGFTSWPLHHETLVLILRAGGPPADPSALAALRSEAADRGIELRALCVGVGCDPAMPIDVQVDSFGALRGWMRQDDLDAFRGPPLQLERLELVERLPRYLELEAEGLTPPAEPVGGDGLRWTIAQPRPGQAYAFSYRARTRIWGRLPLGLGSTARLVHADAGHQDFAIPEGRIAVARGSGEIGPCRTQVAKTAAPARLPLGDPVSIQLDFGADCPEQLRLVDVVLALDVSGSMTGAKLDAARAAAKDFLDILPEGPGQVGLVLFDQALQARLPLSPSFGALRAALDRMQAGGGTSIGGGIQAATELLSARREGVQAAMIVMTDGFDNLGSAPVIAAADQAKAAGILMITVCFGPACDPSLSLAASSPAHAHNAADGEALRRRFADLAVALRQLGLASAEVEDILPANMRYVEGSAEPPAVWDPVARSLRWRFDSPSATGSPLRYRAEPLLLGGQPTNARAELHYVDDAGRPGQSTFPVPRVETYIPEPEGPCAPRLAKTALPWRLPLGDRSELRLELSLDCPERKAPLDLILALDHSASMGSLDRLTNAKRAVAAFLGRLDPQQARVGLVAFADEVTEQIPIGADRTLLLTAVDRLDAAGSTAISQALNAARDMLALRRPEAKAVVILLTDGENSAGSEPMLAAAGRLRADGTQIVTICADPGRCDAALAQVASGPDHAFDVAESARLVDLLDALAQDLSRDRVRELVIEDQLASAVRVDAASIVPPPEAYDGSRIRWRFDALDPAGIQLRYEAEPRLAGAVPVSRLARVDYRLGLGGAGRAWFPAAVLEVYDPSRPAPSPVPSVGPSPSASPSPRATPTPGSRSRILLPYAWR